jgi:hypothetical protein
MKKIAVVLFILVLTGCASIPEKMDNAYRAGYIQGYVDGARLTKEGSEAVNSPGATERFFRDFRESSKVIYGEPQNFVKIADH